MRLDHAPFLPETFDTEAFPAFRVPMTTCGAFWAQQIATGLKVLNTLPEHRLLTLRYEDFFQNPKGQLDLLAGSLGDDLLDDGWSAACAATVRPPRSTWRDLPDSDARALTEACRPGFEQLRAAGVNYAL